MYVHNKKFIQNIKRYNNVRIKNITSNIKIKSSLKQYDFKDNALPMVFPNAAIPNKRKKFGFL